MASLDAFVAASQEQHRRYFEMFGVNPEGGDGLRALSWAIHASTVPRVQDIRHEVIGLGFSTAVLRSYIAATSADHIPLERAATMLDAGAEAGDTSRRINIDGAAKILANSRMEAAEVAAVPDPDSPAGQAAIVGIVSKYQASSAAVMEESAAAEQAAGRKAMNAGSGGEDGLPPDHGGIEAVDYTTQPLAPPQPLPESPWQYNIDFTSEVEAFKDGMPPVSAGSIASIDDVWNELHRCFNCNFPMGGAPKAFPNVGDELPLEIRTAGQKLLNFPVRVTEIQRTASAIDIEFVTLPGHVDGPDSTIHFRFFEQGGQLHLATHGLITQGPGSEDVPILSPGLRSAYTGVAHAVWQPYINNLTRNIANSKGYVTYGP
ncbi:hypothetical protein [Mycobacterium intracellulare]|nr:hypothetical protein [Mycobacterium intracellulare]OCB20049.1 hypothetical protein A5689_21290 [Mycobacterium intracellulare subsp. yongonense]